MLQELAELGMALAREAAQRALKQAGDMDAEPMAAGGVLGRRTARDHGMTFDRLSRGVRQTIALEARIAADEIGGASRCPERRGDTRSAHPDLPAIRRFLHAMADEDAGADADRADLGDLHREIDERLDDDAALTSYGDAPAAEIIETICDDLGITIDAALMPDELLKAEPAGMATPGFTEGDAGDIRLPARPAGPDPP